MACVSQWNKILFFSVSLRGILLFEWNSQTYLQGKIKKSNCYFLPCLFVHLQHWLESESVTVSRPTLCDPMHCSLPGSSVHGILQARILEWVAISFSRASSRPRDGTQVSCIGRQTLYHLSHQGRPMCFDHWEIQDAHGPLGTSERDRRGLDFQLCCSLPVPRWARPSAECEQVKFRVKEDNEGSLFSLDMSCCKQKDSEIIVYEIESAHPYLLRKRRRENACGEVDEGETEMCLEWISRLVTAVQVRGPQPPPVGTLNCHGWCDCGSGQVRFTVIAVCLSPRLDCTYPERGGWGPDHSLYCLKQRVMCLGSCFVYIKSRGVIIY